MAALSNQQDFDNLLVSHAEDVVDINLPYADAHDVLLDGILNELTLGPITEDTAREMALVLLDLLIDANEIVNQQDHDRL